jgi:hypothetical protein
MPWSNGAKRQFPYLSDRNSYRIDGEISPLRDYGSTWWIGIISLNTPREGEP